jgi:Uma2 family endonuclease
MTADELYLLPKDDKRHELIRGELTTMNPPGGNHAMIVVNVATLLKNFVKPRRLGVVLSDPGFVLQRNPDTVRAPDVAFLSAAIISPKGVEKAFFQHPPELAIEVVSPGDSAREVADKTQEYLAGGAREVWIVQPEDRTVVIHRAGGEVITLGEEDTLDGGTLLPGFTCRVVEFFEPY